MDLRKVQKQGRDEEHKKTTLLTHLWLYMAPSNVPRAQSPPNSLANNFDHTEQSSKSSSNRHPDSAWSPPIPSQLSSIQLTSTASSSQFPPLTNTQSKPTQLYAAACPSQTSLTSSSTTKTDPAPIPHNSPNISQAQEWLKLVCLIHAHSLVNKMFSFQSFSYTSPLPSDWCNWSLAVPLRL